MTLLILGIVLFAGPHLMSTLAPGFRDGLKQRFGESPWKMAYSLVTLVGLALMIWGFRQSWHGGGGGELVYPPPAWGRHVTMLLVLLGFIAIGASHGKGHLALWIKHPMSIGVSLWAVGHLISNGRLADVLLFGTMLVIGVLDIVFATARGKLPAHVPSASSDAKALAVGLGLYALFLLVVHPYVFGIAVI
jgi:uncharacterized membrane protein